MIRLFVMFIAGLVGWWLALSRSLMMDAGKIGQLCVLIFSAEFLGAIEGIYLARNGTWLDAVLGALAMSFGGAAATWLLRHKIKEKGIR